MVSIRITRSWQELQDLQNLFVQSVWFQEGDGISVKMHVHGYIENYSPVTVRKKLRTLGLKGNEDFSVTECKTLITYLSYISKSGLKVYDGTSIDWSIIPKWVPPEKVDKMSMLDKMFTGSDTTDRMELSMLCVRYLLDNNKIVNKNMVKNYVDTWLCKVDSVFLLSYCQSI